MKNFMHYSSAMLSTRSRGERLIKVYSSKLGRRLQFFRQSAFEQWLMLEADPSVRSFVNGLPMVNLRYLTSFRPLKYSSILSDIFSDF